MARLARRHSPSSARSSSSAPPLDTEQHRQRRRQKISLRDAAQLLQIAVRHDRIAQLQRVAVLRRFLQDVPLRSDVARQRHHQVFTDGVDGRIRDLREELLEIVEERLRPVRQARQRRICTHRADRLLAALCHGRHDEADVFFGIPEGTLPHQNVRRVERMFTRRVRQRLEADLVFLQPGTVWLAPAQRALDLLVRDRRAFHRGPPAAFRPAEGSL